MDALNNLLLGFSVALAPINLFWCFVGVVLGTVVGVLPGLGPAATIAMLLPLTLKMDHTTAIITLAGIFYGARYGGSTTSILLNMPGESSSVATCLDGYQMARNGRAGAALGISAIASFVAGTVGVSRIDADLAALGTLRFAFRAAGIFRSDDPGPRHGGVSRRRFDGQSAVRVVRWSCGSQPSAPICFTAESRFTFGQTKLLGGVDFIAATVGIFAVAEVLINLESRGGGEIFKLPKGIKNLLPTLQDLKGLPFRFRERFGDRLFRRRAARRRCDRCVVFCPTVLRKRCRAIRKNSAPASSKASPHPRAPTTPTPAARLCLC